ncbi:MAG: PAS domain S-box protein [Ideonella sp.]|nr:PAS domain S-box protein [Ideonella sp.]MCC7457964.1 PAS domain S-box protein [Nitrospira sp.]
MAESLYRQLCDASPDGIVVTDDRGRIVRVNRRAEVMFGYDAGGLDGLSIEGLLPTRYRAVHERHRGHFMANASSRPMGTGMSLIGQRRDGSEFPIEVGLSPLAGGRAAAFVRDLSPTRRGREAFKHARYQEVVRRYTQEAFTTPDLEQVVQRTPELLVAAFDCDASELFMLSRDRREFRVRAAFGLPPDVAAEPAANDLRTLTGFVAASGTPLVVEDLQADPRWRDEPLTRVAGHRSALAVPLQLRDQTVGVLTVRSREVMRVSHDEVSLLTAVAHLLTVVLERQQGEERLAQGQKLEALGQLTGGVAHDFNNILTVVLGNLQLLDDLLQGEPRALKYAANAARAAQRGADLTRKLLTFARKQPLAPKAVPVAEFLRGWSDLLARTFGESIQLAIRADDPDLVLLTDPGLLETALLNLALNARDAMPHGGRLTVQAEAVSVAVDDPLDARELKPGPYVLISVTDTGHGMDAQVLRHVFEPFFTTKDGRGSGLGLAMVYGFVKQTGGGVAVYSEPGHGSTFKLYLPRAQPTAAATAAAAVSRPLGHERVLVVEDDADVRLLATIFLEATGYTVVEVADAAQALALLRDDPGFDLVFSDVVLPGGTSGAQLAQQALRQVPGLRVLLASGYPRDALSGLDGDVDRIALLTKPYSRDDLARAVRMALDA